MRTALRTLLIPQSKSKIKAGDGTNNGTYKFFTSSPVQSKYYHEATYDRPALIFGTGGNASVHFCDEPFSTSTDCLVMYGSAEANLELIYQYLCTNIHILQAGFKGAGLQHISKDYILDIEIDFPDKEKQTALTGKVRTIDHMLWNCRQQLVKLDELVKSRFIEQFGDLASNPHGFTVVPLQELINRGMITYHLDGNHGGDYPRSEEFTAEGVPYIGANCIVGGRIDFTMAKHLPPERAKRLRKGIAQHGDVLFAHNATVGPVVVLETQEPKVILSTSLTAYRCNTESINPYYLSSYMRSDGFVNQYSAEMKQTTRNQVPITAQKKYLFMIPPIEQQEQFAAFVEQTEKSKLVVQQSLEKLETLKKSLMQQYFG